MSASRILRILLMSRTYNIDLHEEAEKEVKKYPPKQFKQVIAKILALRKNPRPPDARDIKNYPGAIRADQGEYRILYTVDSVNHVITVVKIGKRNDEEIYRNLHSLKQAVLTGALKLRR